MPKNNDVQSVDQNTCHNLTVHTIHGFTGYTFQIGNKWHWTFDGGIRMDATSEADAIQNMNNFGVILAEQV